MAACDEAGRAHLEVMFELGFAGCTETQQAERGEQNLEMDQRSRLVVKPVTMTCQSQVTNPVPWVGWQVMCPDLPTVIDPYLKQFQLVVYLLVCCLPARTRAHAPQECALCPSVPCWSPVPRRVPRVPQLLSGCAFTSRARRQRDGNQEMERHGRQVEGLSTACLQGAPSVCPSLGDGHVHISSSSHTEQNTQVFLGPHPEFQCGECGYFHLRQVPSTSSISLGPENETMG